MPVHDSAMDTFSYKSVTTSRGLKYHYFASPSRDAKPTLLFVHGFPSTSYDWRYQVAFFQKEGYGLIVPDMLGYGGTDKPKDTALYKMSAISADIIDILNTESVEKSIAIGHDWGSGIVSRLATCYPDRFLAFAFLALPYLPPDPNFDIEKLDALMKEVVGYETMGYWLFFAEDGADVIIESHWDSFLSVIYPHDPELWKTDMAPAGKFKAWLLADQKRPLPPYITEADKQKTTETLLSGGIAAPLHYYKIVVSGIAAEDDKNIPKERYTLHHPVFFGGATQDYICLSGLAKAMIGQHCNDVTIKEFATDHWVQLAAPDELNEELLAWIRQIQV